MKLVVVESPAKCSKIAGFLGPDYKVLASMGHIRALEEGLDAIGLDRDFEPKFTFMKEKAKAIAALKEAAATASEVILAADDDREGEAIAYSVALLLKLPLATTKRAIFHEITKTAVCNAISKPRFLDMDRVYAQQARAMLDMMIGFTISPLLWKHVARGLSAGRCQTPALRFVIDREDEVAGHSAETSWIVRGTWIAGSNQFEAALNEELGDEESATNYLENMLTVPTGTITATQTRPWTENPPPPLITSTLQQSASSLFHSNPKNTMRIAQRLYEAGHITYMRTDKAVLCAEAIAEAQSLVTTKYGPEYVGFAAAAAEEPTKKKAPKAKAAKADADEPKAQEAHEAIRPTHFDMEVLAGDEWTPLDRNIYKLIRARALQAVMASARGESISVKLLPEGEEDTDLSWTGTGRRTLFQGWRIVGAKPVNDDAEADEADEEAPEAFTVLSSLKVGTKVQWTAMETQPHITKASPRYTEATLVKALEQRGIGRPSTFASLLDAIMEKAYVEKKNIEGTKVSLNKYSIRPGAELQKTTFTRALGAEKDRLVPTELGRQMLAFAVKHFADLFDYGYTAGLETRLDHISEGKEQWKSVLKETWTSYKDRVTALSAVTGTSTTAATVKDLGGGLKAQMTKKGPLLIQEGSTPEEKATFHGWPTGIAFADITAEVAREFISKKSMSVPIIGSYDGAEISLHKGQYGNYVKWKDINVSVKAEDGLDVVIEKIKTKISGGANAATGKQTVGPFTFSTGPYGPYMYKTDLKTKKFVSVPAGTDPSKLTIREADEIYKKALEEKEAKAKAGAKFAAIRAAKGQAY